MVDADGHDRHPRRVHTHLGRDVPSRRLGHRHHPRELLGDADLHAQETEPTPLGDALPGSLGVGKRKLAVDGDGVVEGDQHGPAVVEHPEQS